MIFKECFRSYSLIIWKHILMCILISRASLASFWPFYLNQFYFLVISKQCQYMWSKQRERRSELLLESCWWGCHLLLPFVTGTELGPERWAQSGVEITQITSHKTMTNTAFLLFILFYNCSDFFKECVNMSEA